MVAHASGSLRQGQAGTDTQLVALAVLTERLTGRGGQPNWSKREQPTETSEARETGDPREAGEGGGSSGTGESGGSSGTSDESGHWWTSSGGLGRASIWVQVVGGAAFLAAMAGLALLGPVVTLPMIGTITVGMLLAVASSAVGFAAALLRDMVSPALGDPSRRLTLLLAAVPVAVAAIATALLAGVVPALITLALSAVVGFYALLMSGPLPGRPAGGAGGGSGGTPSTPTSPTRRFWPGRNRPWASATGAGVLVGGAFAVLGGGAGVPLLLGAGAAIFGWGAMFLVGLAKRARGPPSVVSTFLIGAAVLTLALVIGQVAMLFAIVAVAGFVAAIMVLAGWGGARLPWREAAERRKAAVFKAEAQKLTAAREAWRYLDAASKRFSAAQAAALAGDADRGEQAGRSAREQLALALEIIELFDRDASEPKLAPVRLAYQRILRAHSLPVGWGRYLQPWRRRRRRLVRRYGSTPW